MGQFRKEYNVKEKDAVFKLYFANFQLVIVTGSHMV